MKKLLSLGILLLSGSLAFAAPSTTITTPNPFSAQTTIQSSSVNQNFSQVSTIFNAHTHTDITQLGTVTTGNWAGTAITTQYGGTGTNLSASPMGSVVYLSSTGVIAALSPGTSGQFLKTNGAGVIPAWATAGVIKQIVYNTTTSEVTDNTHMPYTSVPQNTDGSQALTLAITPTSATSILKIEADMLVAAGASDYMSIALFQDSTAAALNATLSASSNILPLHLTYFMTAGTTSSTTFKIRFGTSGNTSYLNKTSIPGSLYGAGFAVSSMCITEYAN